MVPAAYPFDFFAYNSVVEVLAHIVLGLMIAILSFVIVYFCFQSEVKWGRPLSILAVLFVLVSMLAGFAFVSSHDKSHSMTMASSYISGFSVYFIMMYQIGKKGGGGSGVRHRPHQIGKTD